MEIGEFVVFLQFFGMLTNDANKGWNLIDLGTISLDNEEFYFFHAHSDGAENRLANEGNENESTEDGIKQYFHAHSIVNGSGCVESIVKKARLITITICFFEKIIPFLFLLERALL